MKDTTTVDQPARKGRLVVVSAKYPSERLRSLEAVRVLRGDASISETVRAALDEFVAKYITQRDAA